MASKNKTETALTRSNDEVIKLLQELGQKLHREEDVIFDGKKFILPTGITIKEGIKFLTQKELEDEKVTSFSRTFHFRPWDGAFCTYNTLRKAFGMVRLSGTQSFFGENPPYMITIDIGVNETTEIPWGNFQIPLLPGVNISVGGSNDEEYGQIFKIDIEGPRKYRSEVDGIFKLVEDELNSSSIYRGKAIDGKEMPSFLDLSTVDPEKVTYSEHVMSQLTANVWNLIRHTKRVEDIGLPLKRSVLLEGEFGTGKTLAAFLTAQEAVKNGWTFILARPGRDKLEDVMRTARLYQPSVVFMEDLDTVDGAGLSGDQDMVSNMLDLFDGVRVKGTKLIAIMTTNHKERINKGMVRPGRLDAVIHIGKLDRTGVERLIRNNIKHADMISPDVDFDIVYEAMKDYTPAFVKEAGDRAIHYALSRNDSEIILSTNDLVEAALGLKDQLELLNGSEEKEPDTLGIIFERHVDHALSNGSGEKVKKLLHEAIDEHAAGIK